MFTIVVPIKNQLKIVEQCVTSIIKNYIDQEVILVDDGSTEKKLLTYYEYVDNMVQSPNWQFVFNNKSFGHSRACEIGIEKTHCENIFLLNSDTILTQNCLHILSDVLDSDPNIAVVGPSTSSASGEQLIKEAFDKRFVWTVDEIEEYAKKIENGKKEILDIDLVNGFCLGIKRSVWEKVVGGKFDSNLSCYGNEKDVLISVRKAGYRTVFVLNAYCHHFGKMSYSHENINIGRAQIDADRYLMRKWGSLK